MNTSSPSPRKAHKLGGGVLGLFPAVEGTGQDPAPQDIECGLIQVLEFGFVHTGERDAARVFAERAIW